VLAGTVALLLGLLYVVIVKKASSRRRPRGGYRCWFILHTSNCQMYHLTKQHSSYTFNFILQKRTKLEG
jgi:hypothetical protein